MDLPNSFKEMNKHSQDARNLTQGKVLSKYISNPLYNLAGFGNGTSSYKDFILKMYRNDAKSAEHLANITANEIWHKMEARGEYEGPDVLNNVLAAHWMGYPEEQEKLEQHLDNLEATDAARFRKEYEIYSELFDIAKKGIYCQGGFMDGGPAPQKPHVPETGMLSKRAGETHIFKEDVKKYLLKLDPKISYKERKFRKPKAILEKFDYENMIGKQLERAGKGSIKTLYAACKELEKEGPEEKRLGIKLIREMSQDMEHYHPVRKKVIMGSLAGIVTIAAAGSIYHLFQNNNNFDEDRDGLLNGSNETLQSNSGQAQRYLSAGILHRVNDDGSITFFGEQTLGSNPHVPSPDAVDNARFLGAISQAEYNKIKTDGNLSNFNIDGDSWSNWFEHVTGSPYNVKNDIYAIIMTHAGQDYPPVKEMFDILEKAKIPKDHIYDLSLQNNNSVEFKKASDKIAQVSDKNDTVLFVIDGEGVPGEFQFHGVMENGEWHPLESVPYTWFRDITNKIPSKNKIFIVDTCFSGSAIKDLEGNDRIVLTNATANQKSAFGVEYDFLKAFSNPLADTDKNNHVSIGEAAQYAKISQTFDARQAQLSDTGNIGKTSYLIEQIVD